MLKCSYLKTRVTHLGITSSFPLGDCLASFNRLLTASTKRVGVIWLAGVSINSRAKFWAVATVQPLDQGSVFVRSALEGVRYER